MTAGVGEAARGIVEGAPAAEAAAAVVEEEDEDEQGAVPVGGYPTPVPTRAIQVRRCSEMRRCSECNN
jgi:hypothetical protein